MRSRLTYSNVMATVAVFIALGGAAYAATKLPKNSVGARQIKKSAIVTAKIKNQAVTGSKIGDSAVSSAKLQDGAVSTARLEDNSVSSAKVQDGGIGRADLTPIGFTQAPLENGWTNSGGAPTPSFGVDAEGFVHLRGRARNPAGTAANGTAIFTLPGAARPQELELFPGAEVYGGYSATCAISIEPSGAVVAGILGENNPNGCQPNGAISLSGISFLARPGADG